MKRRAVFTLSAALLASCGGGGASAAQELPLVNLEGDSLTSSHIAVPPGRLAVPTVRRINELAADRFLAIDNSQPGARIVDALEGSDTMPGDPYATRVRITPARVAVLRWGGSDAILGTAPDLFGQQLREMVRLTRDAGVAPLLVEVINHDQWKVQADIFNAINHQVATDTSTPIVLIRDLPWALVDRIHPDQATADAIDGRITTKVLELLQ
ncbi:hypothetical protein ACFPOE_11320 [Caenimonas terrae]|uniref:SGNH hydrolase-type esterase domain-containing protein n=1 Tax=Caenimonas terrae TaxID=696074 RepID=A0ABW0NCV5_9BURK